MATMIVLSDNDVRGDVAALRRVIESAEWAEFKDQLGLRFRNLEDIGLTSGSPDREIYIECQRIDAVLITGDRSPRDGPESLARVMEELGNDHSLPVMTIPEPGRAHRDRAYAGGCAECLIDYLLRIESLRGRVRRLYLSPPRR
jgi:hypothetical protein